MTDVFEPMSTTSPPACHFYIPSLLLNPNSTTHKMGYFKNANLFVPLPSLNYQ